MSIVKARGIVKARAQSVSLVLHCDDHSDPLKDGKVFHVGPMGAPCRTLLKVLE